MANQVQFTENIGDNLAAVIFPYELRKIVMKLALEVLTYYHPNTLSPQLRAVINEIRRVPAPTYGVSFLYGIDSISIRYRGGMVFHQSRSKGYPVAVRYALTAQMQIHICRKSHGNSQQCNEMMMVKDYYACRMCPICRQTKYFNYDSCP